MRKGDFQYASGSVSLLSDLTRTTGLPRDPCRVLQRTPLRMRELTETFHLWKSPKSLHTYLHSFLSADICIVY